MIHDGISICFKSENLSLKSVDRFIRWLTTTVALSVTSHFWSQSLSEQHFFCKTVLINISNVYYQYILIVSQSWFILLLWEISFWTRCFSTSLLNLHILLLTVLSLSGIVFTSSSSFTRILWRNIDSDGFIHHPLLWDDFFQI